MEPPKQNHMNKNQTKHTDDTWHNGHGLLWLFWLLWMEDKCRKERLMSGDSDPDVLPLRQPRAHPFSAFTPGFPQQDQGSNWFPACCEWPELTGLWRAATLSAAQTHFPLPPFFLPTLMCLKHSHIVFLQIWVKMTLGSYTIPKAEVFEKSNCLIRTETWNKEWSSTEISWG